MFIGRSHALLFFVLSAAAASTDPLFIDDLLCFQCCIRSPDRCVSACWRSAASSPSTRSNADAPVLLNPSACACKELNRTRVAFRYGVEPPVLVKLEKEIELEESLMLTEEPPPVLKTFSVCCQHGGLYQSGVSFDLSGKESDAGVLVSFFFFLAAH